MVIPAELVAEIDRIVGKRRRSGFLVQAAAQELKRLRLLHALDRAAGSWKDREHPELAQGAAAWIRTQRRADERRRRMPR